jgi:RNA recognition motif-containing protein
VQGKFDKEKELKALFESFGPLNSFTIVRHGGGSKGFGFAEYKRSDHATA